MNDALAHIKTIAKRELAGYFASPVPYVFIVIFCLWLVSSRSWRADFSSEEKRT